MNHEKTHRQLMDWIDKLAVAISIVVAIGLAICGLLGIGGPEKGINVVEGFLISMIAIFIGVIFVLHRTSFRRMQDTHSASITLMHDTITDLQNAIEEDINKIVALRGDFDIITTLLKDIIYSVTDKNTKKDNIGRATKRLNGVKQILKTDMVELNQAKNASKSIENCRSSISAVSTLAIAECLEPAFFEYFVVQICKFAEMDDKKKDDPNMNFSAERYFVYDPDVLTFYNEELVIFERLHEKGKIKFDVLDANIVRSSASDVLNKLDKKDKELLEKEKNRFPWPRSNEGYIPDFLLIDERNVYGRDQNGDIITTNAEDIPYYNALIKFFREVRKPDYHANWVLQQGSQREQ